LSGAQDFAIDGGGMTTGIPQIDPRVEIRRIDQRYTTFRTFIRAAAVFGVAFVGFGALREFAGKATEVSVAFGLLLNALIELKFLAAISLTGAACAWAAVERWLRHRKVESMQARIRELETAIDPNRSTSGLTPRGQTNPRDVRR
jgi:hypothetical protein